MLNNFIFYLRFFLLIILGLITISSQARPFLEKKSAEEFEFKIRKVDNIFFVNLDNGETESVASSVLTDQVKVVDFEIEKDVQGEVSVTTHCDRPLCSDSQKALIATQMTGYFILDEKTLMHFRPMYFPLFDQTPYEQTSCYIVTNNVVVHCVQNRHKPDTCMCKKEGVCNKVRIDYRTSRNQDESDIPHLFDTYMTDDSDIIITPASSTKRLCSVSEVEPDDRPRRPTKKSVAEKKRRTNTKVCYARVKALISPIKDETNMTYLNILKATVDYINKIKYENKIKSERNTPEVVPEAVPEVVPEVVPEAVPEVVPEAVPEVVPEAVPEVVPEAVPEVVPEVNQQPDWKPHRPWI